MAINREDEISKIKFALDLPL